MEKVGGGSACLRLAEKIGLHLLQVNASITAAARHRDNPHDGRQVKIEWTAATSEAAKINGCFRTALAWNRR